METTEHCQRFNHSLQIWEHAPAFWVVSNNNNTPQQVFHSNANNEYNVELRSMMGSVESNDIQFWTNEKGNKDNNINNLRIRFNQHAHTINRDTPTRQICYFVRNLYDREIEWYRKSVNWNTSNI